MSKEITDGLTLMPPPFAEGLDVWSLGDGTPGSASCEGWPGADIVHGDPDFGTCLEVRAPAPLTRIRYTGETPILPGCYLRIRARVRSVSGAPPGVRVAAWAGSAASAHVPGLPEAGPAVTLPAPGAVAEVSAIVGTGTRTGVDLAWGRAAAYGHFGLDILGPGGSVVRIENLVVEDVTSVFQRAMADCIDVRDYGAVGDGVTDDASAFAAADRDARGRRVVVPEGVYRLARDLRLAAKVRFWGRVRMAPEHRLVLCRSLDLATYEDAFGDTITGFRRAFQALLSEPDCTDLDLSARRIPLSAPLDLAAAAGCRRHRGRKVIRNGAFVADRAWGWADDALELRAHVVAADLLACADRASVARVARGALVTGNGLGPEVYVAETDAEAGTVRLSRPALGDPRSGRYRVRRFGYLLDGAGFEALSGLEFEGVGLHGEGVASAVLLPPEATRIAFRNCIFEAVGPRGVSAPGAGACGQELAACRIVAAPGRIAWCALGGAATVRDCHFEGVALTLDGTDHRVAGNRWCGAGASAGGGAPRLVFTAPAARAVVTGNLLRGVATELAGDLAIAANLGGG